MPCKICHNCACASWFHSFEEQEEWERLAEIYGEQYSIATLREMEEEESSCDA